MEGFGCLARLVLHHLRGVYGSFLHALGLNTEQLLTLCRAGPLRLRRGFPDSILLTA